MPDAAGRPTRLTKKLIETLCHWVGKGHYLKTAAALSGVSYRALGYWLKEGREGKNSKTGAPASALALQLVQSIEKAQGEAVNLHVENILNAAGNGQWQASAWYLERTKPDEYGRKDAHRFVDKDNNDVRPGILVVPPAMSAEDWDKVHGVNGDSLIDTD